MYDHLINFISRSNITYIYKFGFRKQYSTNHAILSAFQKNNDALSRGNFMIGVFLDMKKVIDIVDYHILICKLHAYGIRGSILE